MDFEPISVKNKAIITSYIIPSNQQDCELSFSNLFCWHFITASSFAIIDNQLVLRFTNSEGEYEYFMPMGKGNIFSIIEKLENIAKANGSPLILRGVLPDMQNKLEQCFPTLFEYVSDRDYFDYIYNRQDLVELRGKNYQAKRNHVNKFRKEYHFEYLPLTHSLIPECLKFEAEWCVKHGYIENDNIRNERRALILAMQHYDELGLRGGVIHVDGKIAAFTFGAPVNHNTFGIHCEKADVNIDGVYSAINQFFAQSLPEEYIYVNREEDMGVPGLRKAKESYHPAIILEKSRAIKR